MKKYNAKMLLALIGICSLSPNLALASINGFSVVYAVGGYFDSIARTENTSGTDAILYAQFSLESFHDGDGYYKAFLRTVVDVELNYLKGDTQTVWGACDANDMLTVQANHAFRFNGAALFIGWDSSDDWICL